MARVIEWYKKKPEFFFEEKKIIQIEFPDLKYVFKEGKVTLSGALGIAGEISGVRIDDWYSIAVDFPDDYPSQVPILRETGNRKEDLIRKRHLKNIGEIHYNIGESGNPACLCPRVEQDEIFFESPNINTYLKKLVVPFFTNQSYFELTGKWLVDGYSHGKDGILEYYQNKFGTKDEEFIRKCLDLLDTKAKIKGHSFCPCGSNRKIRDCHPDVFQILWQLKECVNPDSLHKDKLGLRSL